MSSMMLPAIILASGLILLMSDNPVPPENLGLARSKAFRCLAAATPGSAVVFDFDGTLFDERTVVSYTHTGPRPYATGDRKAIPIYKPISPVCDILKYATARGMYIVLITARPNSALTRCIVTQNLEHYGLTVHEYHANPHYPQMRNFKAVLRARLHAQRPIVLTVGDQWTDVNEAITYDWIKLPNAREPLMLSSLP